jgi:hypothetical protein
MSLGDRFIPSRVNAEVANQSLLAEDDVQRADTSLSHERYKLQLQRELLGAEHRPPPRLPAAMLASSGGRHHHQHDTKTFTGGVNSVNANSFLDESSLAPAEPRFRRAVVTDSDALDRVTAASTASVTASVAVGVATLSGDVMPGGGDLPRATTARRARSLSTSSLLAHTVDARRLDAASANSTRTSPPTVSVRRRNRLVESGATLFRDAEADEQQRRRSVRARVAALGPGRSVQLWQHCAAHLCSLARARRGARGSAAIESGARSAPSDAARHDDWPTRTARRRATMLRTTRAARCARSCARTRASSACRR